MNNTEKIELVEELFSLRQKLTGIAHRSNESTYSFGRRALSLLKAYKAAGQIAQLELEEIMDSMREREELAIVCFVENLRKDVKRYMCQHNIYESLQQAVMHADQISNNLRDLQNLTERTHLTINPLE